MPHTPPFVRAVLLLLNPKKNAGLPVTDSGAQKRTQRLPGMQEGTAIL